jgi:hypothetical protein
MGSPSGVVWGSFLISVFLKPCTSCFLQSIPRLCHFVDSFFSPVGSEESHRNGFPRGLWCWASRGAQVSKSAVEDRAVGFQLWHLEDSIVKRRCLTPREWNSVGLEFGVWRLFLIGCLGVLAQRWIEKRSVGLWAVPYPTLTISSSHNAELLWVGMVAPSSPHTSLVSRPVPITVGHKQMSAAWMSGGTMWRDLDKIASLVPCIDSGPLTPRCWE